MLSLANQLYQLKNDELDFSTFADICRLCTIKNGPAKIVLFEKEAEQRNLLYKIRSLLPVNIAQDDALPDKICECCASKVEELFNWKSSCMQIDTILRTYTNCIKNASTNYSFQILDIIVSYIDPENFSLQFLSSLHVCCKLTWCILHIEPLQKFIISTIK